MMTGFGMGFGGVGVIGIILFWVAVIAGIVWLARTDAQVSMLAESENGENAREILNQRYARGELNRDEYEAIKQDFQ